jgi:hypothetical protein
MVVPTSTSAAAFVATAAPTSQHAVGTFDQRHYAAGMRGTITVL